MAVTFDGANRKIVLETGVILVDVVADIYSEWKEWKLLSDNAKFAPAFDVSIGGNPVGGGQTVSPYVFMRNDLGWRIRPPEENIEITLVGNLFGADDTLPISTMTLGTFDSVLIFRVSPQSLTVPSGLSSGEQTQLTNIESEVVSIEGGRGLARLIRLVVAAILGKASGLEVNAPVYRDTTDAKDRITATTDAAGNRTAVAYDDTV